MEDTASEPQKKETDEKERSDWFDRTEVPDGDTY